MTNLRFLCLTLDQMNSWAVGKSKPTVTVPHGRLDGGLEWGFYGPFRLRGWNMGVSPITVALRGGSAHRSLVWAGTVTVGFASEASVSLTTVVGFHVTLGWGAERTMQLCWFLPPRGEVAGTSGHACCGHGRVSNRRRISLAFYTVATPRHPKSVGNETNNQKRPIALVAITNVDEPPTGVGLY